MQLHNVKTRVVSAYEYRTEPVTKHYLFPQILRYRGLFYCVSTRHKVRQRRL